VLSAVVAVLTLGVGPASAHVTVSSPDAARGGFGEISFRMPNEKGTAKTTSLKVQLPKDTPFASVSVKPVPGWTAKTITSPLNPPITDDDGNKVTEAVTEIDWTADPGGGLGAGEYQTFSVSAGPLPKNAATVAFPALQGYDDGTTVAWVDPTVTGQPEPQHPAPVLRLAAASGDTSGAAPATTSDTGSGLAITALVIGIVGLLTGAVGVALALGARRSAATGAGTEREREAAGL
jgi:periplasmic copper chaperone A